MTYNIPESLLPYLEYIPEEMLVSIIDDALKEKIFNKPVETLRPVTNQTIDVPQLVEQIRGLLGDKVAPQVEKALKEEPTVTSIKPIMITDDSDTVDEDLQALVDEFAGGMFK